jgi:hypothetical protein
VYSLQFDQQLVNDETVDPSRIECPFVTDTPKTTTPIGASKFIVCIIVSRPSLNRKTTVAQALGKVFQLPIIDLNELWGNMTEDRLTVLDNHPVARIGCSNKAENQQMV